MSRSKKRKITGREKMVNLCIEEDWTCWICGGEVFIDYVEGEPSAPSKDHVVPRSHFKKHRSHYDNEFYRNNIRLAHRFCNSERQSKEVSEEESESYREGLKKAQERWDREH